MSAETSYISVLFAVLALVLWAGAVDLTLYCRGEPTISAWLRLNPLWVYWPMAVALVFIAALLIHLFAST